MKTKKNSQEELTIILDEKATKKDQVNRDSIHKKIKKIKLLTKQVNTLKNQINAIKDLCKNHIDKEEKKLFLNKEKLIVKLYERFQQKAFSNWQKDFIESKILNEIDFLFNNDAMTEKTSEIHRKITALQQENLGDDEKEMMNEMAKEMFKNMGVDIDEDNFDFANFANFANEEFRDNFQENYHQQYSQQQQEAISEKKKEKARTTDKDFQKLYRLLVKKAHPDLVKEGAEKEKREEIMKKLSHAWEHRDYYQLLMIQNEIDANNSFEVSLSKKQLKAIIKQLNEEINEIESIKYQLKKHNPESSYYYQNFFARSEKGILKKIEAHKEQIIMDSIAVENEIKDLKTQKSTKELLKNIKKNTEFYNDDEFLDEIGGLFGDF